MTSKEQRQAQPVVQVILESFTRCFNPANSDYACGGSSRRDHQRSHSSASGNSRGHRSQHRRASSKVSSSSTPTRAVERIELNGKEWDDVFSSGRSSGKSHASADSRKRRPSSRGRAKEANVDSSDTDAVARAKKAAHRIDPEAIEQRSLKRKLEIFRTRDSPEIFQVAPPPPRQMPHGKQSRFAAPEELFFSDSSEEEIANLTSSRKRFACGLGGNYDGNIGPMASFARFFNLGPQPNPFGLCFATPVRTASAEQADKFSDDQLTADEFIERHSGNPHVTPELEASQDGSESQSRCFGEDDTITSTLYFDQKYSHLVQTRPPMPLFHSQMVPCSDYQSDELTQIIKKKHMSCGDLTPSSLSSPQSPPRILTTTSKTRKHHRESNRESRHVMTNAPPSPVNISDKSRSESTNSDTSHARRGPWRMKDPDIVHSTAAEI
ncbi:hypothetical protein HJC23_004953 [Cyclotella cryptica]|uniref:Uncharacterized protein n=1 Tax=Cyclotella cryptica TaxID=29204 RepID=A0ABD3P9B4_9STRA|eukprot:CCRYP_016595-RA/>CCRYP_016595-RA protein AED:0.00 eAED:0.00 QI:628/-1/1/1/-1/1/1/475/437